MNQAQYKLTTIRARQSSRRASCIGVIIVGMTLHMALIPAFAEPLSGKVKVDGSSTVAPITMAAAEMFRSEQPKVQVTVGISGTGGGFKKFLDPKPDLRTDISDASRPIKESEMKQASELGIEFIEIPIAIDGLAVVVHPSNKFCNHLTVAELKKIWEPGSAIHNWSEVRPGFPDLPIKLYGPGTDSGTFDYFTEAIVGKEDASRSDFTASESDNVLVQGVAGDPGSLGYFGFSYFEANKDKLRLVPIDNNNGQPVLPTVDVIRAGKYKPLARPLFLYVNKTAYQRPEVRAFVEYILQNAQKLVEHPRVNYVALPPELYTLAKERVTNGKTGSAMAKAGDVKDNLVEVFRKH